MGGWRGTYDGEVAHYVFGGLDHVSYIFACLYETQALTEGNVA
jgi:hypothetical protein